MSLCKFCFLFTHGTTRALSLDSALLPISLLLVQPAISAQGDSVSCSNLVSCSNSVSCKILVKHYMHVIYLLDILKTLVYGMVVPFDAPYLLSFLN